MYNSVRWELFKTDAQPEGEERTEGTRGLSIPAEKVLPDDSIFLKNRSCRLHINRSYSGDQVAMIKSCQREFIRWPIRWEIRERKFSSFQGEIAECWRGALAFVPI